VHGTAPCPFKANDVWAMAITVKNNGELDMTEATLHVEGQNGTLVGFGPDGPFHPSFVVSVVVADPRTGMRPATIPAGDEVTVPASPDGRLLCFKLPPAPKTSNTLLVSARIQNWNAGLSHLLCNCGPGRTYAPTSGTNLNGQVV
jgi:hypothetical protein